MYKEIATEVTKQLTNSFINYLHLYSWLEIEIHKRFTNRQFTFTSVEEFWKMIFSEELRHGDVIKFKEGFLTDWIPKAAGQVWKTFDPTLPTNAINLHKVKQGQEFSSSGIVEDEQPRPLGVVRLPFNEKTKNFAVLSITSYDCWSVDLGIPVVVSKEIYAAFIKTRKNNQAVEGDIEAVLEISNSPWFDNSFISAHGSSINPDFLNQFTTPLLVPRVFLRVASLINTKFRAHNSHPMGTIWALTKSERPYKIIQGSDLKIQVVSEYNSWIGLELAHIDISNVDNIEYYSKAFQEGHTQPKELFPHVRLAKDPHQKISVLTEFDAQKKHFANSIPIEKEPWKKHNNKPIIDEVLSNFKNGSII